ncbi:chorismate-binding protein [Polynucleobacter necessarius]|uniref:chorismate-binding protein n=1 Tax=Polynucleobacter necessarius TaxID=576610 RepID=UPI0018D5A871|nr:chorismate-binding protein [Polynucleobacter necessarius]
MKMRFTTGAPKKRSMEIIQELEAEDRGYYCGALGWLDPNGNFTFSVPIRTVEIEQDHKSHASRFTLGVGTSITNDSNIKQEREECHIKSAFLMNLPSNTGLLETIAVVNSEPQRLQAHFQRMHVSALAIRIPFHMEIAENVIASACQTLDKDVLCRLRLDLAPDGALSVTTGTLEVVNEPVKIFWAKDIFSGNVAMNA